VIVTDLLSEPYPELTQRAGQIGVAVQAEATRFQKTLEQGLEQFEKVAARAKRIAGEDAFRLHDTFGFPLELTRELAEERGIEVDEEGFHAGMSAQRERSRSGFKQGAADLKGLPRGTTFHFDVDELETQVIGIRRDGNNVQHAFEGDEVEVYLRDTPFYAESGGQIGDTGEIRTQPSGGIVLVEDAQKIADGVIAHIGRITRGEIDMQDNARARIDARRRHAIARHHSATHLLHRALRETLGESVVQKGSWVGPDHTTFDIPLNRAMTRDELSRVNARVMEKVREALPFHESHKPYKEAVAQGAMHLFEEKYGDVVRIVCFGDWTCELCGGTHVKNSADVGTAVIVSESSIGSGLRRIDLVVGEPADELVRRDRELLQDLARSFNAVPEQLPERIASLRAELKAAERERQKLRDELRSARVQGGNGLHVKHGRVDYVTETVDAATDDELK